MTYQRASYQTSFNGPVPMVTVAIDEQVEIFTETKLNQAIEMVRKQRRKYHDKSEWDFVLSTYEQALETLWNDMKVFRCAYI